MEELKKLSRMQQREKEKKIIRKILRGMEDIMKRFTICLIRTSERRFKENRKQAIWKEIRATFPDLLKSMTPTK